MVKVVATTGAISCAKLQSNHHHQQTNTQFFTGQMPFLSPDQQCQNTEGKISHSMDLHLLIPNSPGVFQLCLWPLIAPSYLGGGLPCHQPSDASTTSISECQHPDLILICEISNTTADTCLVPHHESRSHCRDHPTNQKSANVHCLADVVGCTFLNDKNKPILTYQNTTNKRPQSSKCHNRNCVYK